MKTKSIISGAFILSIGGVLAKIFSAVYRIALTRILGGEGIGIYQLIFPLYSLCVVLATAGIPMAISKIIAKNKNKDSSILKKCFVYTSIISLCLMFILLISSGGLSNLQGQKDICICYIILAPSIIIVSVISVLRGYFQGLHNFTPSAISNIVEQFSKLIFGLTLSLSLLKFGLLISIIGAVVSIVLSEVCSLIVLLIYFKKNYVKTEEEINLTYKQLGKEILPITLTNIILPIASFIDSVLVVNLLSLNFSNSFSVFLYGLESGAVASLIGLPTIFSFAVASVIMPNLASGKNEINNNKKLSISIKIILLICVPCAIAFMIIPDRLINVLYSNKLNAFGVDGVKIASKLLAISGIGVVFLSLNQIFSSSLQAIDKSNITIRNLVIAVVLKFLLELIFMPSKVLNIYVLALSNTICYLTVMMLNYLEIKMCFKIDLKYSFIAKLVLCNCFLILTLVSVLAFGNSTINTIIAVILSALIYFILAYKLKMFRVNEREEIKLKK